MPKIEPHFQHIIEFFQSVGRMTWYSFVQNRLPLLKPPTEITWLEQRSANKVHPSFDRMLTLTRRLKFAQLEQSKEKRVRELLRELEQLLKA